MFDTATLSTTNNARRPSANTEVDVALLRDPGDGMAPEADLFRSPAFFRLHAASFTRAWYAVVMDGSTGVTLAGGWFAETAPGEARSGARGPFGGLHSPHAPLPITLATRIVNATEEELRVREIRRVRIVCPPAAHEPESHAEWMNVYQRLGYTSAPPDLHFHAEVGTVPLTDRMTSGNRALARAAERKGMVVRALQPAEYGEAYALNAADRTRRGRRMTISFDALQDMQESIPDSVHWLGAFSGAHLVAAVITFRSAREACQVFTLGEAEGMERQGPGTMLLAHLHDWCRAEGYRRLDLGLATESAVPNEGLVAHMRNLGFDVSAQYTLEKDLAS